MIRFRSLPRRWFEGTLSPGASKRLFSKMKTDPVLRSQFNRLAELELRLCTASGTVPAITHFELERLENMILHQVEGKRKTERKTLWILKPAVAATIAAVFVILPLIFLLPEGKQVTSDTLPSSLFNPRGGDPIEASHLYLFCVEEREDIVSYHRLDRPPFLAGEPDNCDLSSELQFAMTNMNSSLPYLYIWGVDKNHRRHWYYPEPSDHQSVRIDTKQSEKLLGESILLHVNHKPGPVRLFAAFSKEPMTHKDVSSILHEYELSGLDIEESPTRRNLEALMEEAGHGEGVLQSFVFNITRNRGPK